MNGNKIGPELSRIAPKFQAILERTKPYILTFPGNLSQYNLSPWGLSINQEHIFSCIDSRRARFFDLLQSLDQLAFGPVGMPMDKWVFFDCGEMPGGICGLGVQASELPNDVKKLYKLEKNATDFVPISMYISIPMAAPGAWFGHNLSSANTVLGGNYQGLGLLTKVLALKVFNIKLMYGATQWDSKSLNIHLQISDMEMMSAYTPAHSFNKTITYKSIYNDKILIDSLSGKTKDS
ncbi:MAG: hypothetical protein HQK50_14295, partial [Oligoflexia bacterium]|nr:hypothetical protein [Oligoflexia bacterium]